MQWSDEAIILSVRPHGETAAIVELWTRNHGRHLGLVHGGRSRKLRPVLQTGNHVDATWKARLADQLGHVTIELRRGFAAETMENPAALSALTTLAALTRLLPERDPHPKLYEITLFVLSFLDDVTVSRRHAELVRDGETFSIRDLGSLNGTYVNRRRIESTVLEDDDGIDGSSVDGR